jgi:hypothetical protein
LQETHEIEIGPVEWLISKICADQSARQSRQLDPGFPEKPGCVAPPMFATVLTALQEHGFATAKLCPLPEPSTLHGHAFKEEINRQRGNMAKGSWNDNATREWLAKHDAKRAPAQSPRFERWQKRKKAREQAREQERRELATPLLKGVK